MKQRDVPRSGARLLAVPVALAVAALLVAACSSTSNTASNTNSGSAPGGTTAGTTPAPEPDAPKVTVTAQENGADFSFSGPDTFPAGWVELDLVNQGKQSHQAGLAHLRPGATPEQLQAAIKVDVNNALPLLLFDGGPNSVAPGATQKTIVFAQPGPAFIYCVIPDVGDATRKGDNQPHISHGMIKQVTVTSASSTTSGSTPGSTRGSTPGSTVGSTPPGTVAKPSGDPVPVVGNIDLKDYGVLLPEPFTGKGWYKITNLGPQPHEMGLIKLAPGTSADAARAAIEAAEAAAATSTTMAPGATMPAGSTPAGTAPSGTVPGGPPPFTDAGGFGAIDAGGVGYLYLDLPPGNYVGLCFIPDVPAPGRTGNPDFKPHYAHGMFQAFTIT